MQEFTKKCRRPRPRTTLGASLRSRNAFGHFTCKSYFILYEHLQIKCRWAAGAPWSSTGLYTYRKSPSVWAHCLGKKIMRSQTADRNQFHNTTSSQASCNANRKVDASYSHDMCHWALTFHCTGTFRKVPELDWGTALGTTPEPGTWPALHRNLPEPDYLGTAPEPSATWAGSCTGERRSLSGLKIPLADAAAKKTWVALVHGGPHASPALFVFLSWYVLVLIVMLRQRSKNPAQCFSGVTSQSRHPVHQTSQTCNSCRFPIRQVGWWALSHSWARCWTRPWRTNFSLVLASNIKPTSWILNEPSLTNLCWGTLLPTVSFSQPRKRSASSCTSSSKEACGDAKSKFKNMRFRQFSCSIIKTPNSSSQSAQGHLENNNARQSLVTTTSRFVICFRISSVFSSYSAFVCVCLPYLGVPPKSCQPPGWTEKG